MLQCWKNARISVGYASTPANWLPSVGRARRRGVLWIPASMGNNPRRYILISLAAARNIVRRQRNGRGNGCWPDD
jgi:hypothetical protein